METVFRLRENRVCIGLEYLRCDLQAAIRRQAVHHERARFCQREQFIVDLVARELRLAELRLLLLAHAHPHIGVEHIRAARCFLEIVRDDEPSAPRVFKTTLPLLRTGKCTRDGRRIRLKLRGRGDAQLKVELRRRPQPRTRDVARAVADESHHAPSKVAEPFHNGLQVGKNLARMLVVRERVHRGDAAEFRKILHIALRKRADDRALAHPPEHTRRVRDGLAAPELDVVRREEKHIAAEFANADLEGHTRARRGFGKHERPALVTQRMFIEPPAHTLHPRSEVEDDVYLVPAQRFDGQQVFHGFLRLLEKGAKDAREPPRGKLSLRNISRANKKAPRLSPGRFEFCEAIACD